MRVVVHVPGCIDGRDFGLNPAHAHPHPQDPHCGTICFRTIENVTNASFIHEISHLLAGMESGHGPRWEWALAFFGRISLRQLALKAPVHE